MQDLADLGVEALFVEYQRDLVDVSGIGAVDDGTRVYVAEVGDLSLQVIRECCFAPTDNGVRLDASAAQLSDRVLGGLRLLLA